MTTLDCQIREMRDSDRPLIIQTWLRHYRRTVRWLPTNAYYELYERMVLHTLDHHTVICSVSTERTSQVFSWACYDRPLSLLHFVYTKSKYRGIGQATGLIAEMLQQTGRKLVPTNWTSNLSVLSHYLSDIRPDLFCRVTREVKK